MALDRQFAVQSRESLGDALKAEVPLGDAGCAVWIEAAAIVANGESERAVRNRARDLDCGGLAVAKGVRRQFADDPEDSVGGVVRERRTGDRRP